ncbi:unnamed protein product [Vitrella brassicaformis CCMP3155]|uniref:60S ribosomal protein L34 n=1 Tax=Vitrella brassicaformis (strain CCMP3155) TaxID=1169540 RepID=A0A0G4FRA9_VITBC|nr:unnamed protein product [Vitrella brassicaformis CCMP3155]|eukprot:CEM16581.1 unnamed protein product [Vitrella brassicaformis CCMP3155]
MVQRLTYRRKVRYNTPSNKQIVVKTPGGVNTYHLATKRSARPRCAQANCHIPLAGIPAVRPRELKYMKKRQRRVSRAYGGNLCHICTRDRIVRAFLIEEQKLVKKVLKEKEAAKSADKAPAAVASTAGKKKKGSK